MVARLLPPFPSLSAENLLSRGSAGHVYAISQNVVVKCPTLFDNPNREQLKEMEESIEKLENERAIYQVLMKHRHANIIYGILCIPKGLFMHRQETTLEARIARSTVSAISPKTQERWIQQIASALAWIEDLGYAHGDLRPANIFLSTTEDIRLGDFDATVKKGERLLVASEPFCKLNAKYELPCAGPLSEQFSLASCIYTIRFGHIPFHDVDAPVRVKKLIKGLLPTTSTDAIFGSLMKECWKGHYDSIKDVEYDILQRLGIRSNVGKLPCGDMQTVDGIQVTELEAECYEFLTRSRGSYSATKFCT